MMILRKNKQEAKCHLWWACLLGIKLRYWVLLFLLVQLFVFRPPETTDYNNDISNKDFVRTNNATWSNALAQQMFDGVENPAKYNSRRVIKRTTKEANNMKKKILYYTTYWNSRDFQFGLGHEPFDDYDCPVSACVAHSRQGTNKRVLEADFGNYDAVLFAPTDWKHINLAEIQQWRRPHQRFVYLNMESPAYMGAKIPSQVDVSNFFNWTMTYRWDSDIPRPYGWFTEKQGYDNTQQSTTTSNFYAQPPPLRWIPYQESTFVQSLQLKSESFHALAKRPGKVVWVVSNCQTASRREEYVRLLKRHISVDIFGNNPKCGATNTCNARYSIHDQDNCTIHIQNNYKFYLSFENSFCNDYVTEKLFRRMEFSVPIVLGQSNYSHLAPPHSYIDIFNFPSPKALAEYLHQLDQNDTEYLSYFWWKDHYTVHHPYKQDVSSSSTGSTPLKRRKNNFRQSMCHLCAKLHDISEPPKVYDNFITDWWEGQAECGKLAKDLNVRIRDGLFGTNFPGARTSNRTFFGRADST